MNMPLFSAIFSITSTVVIGVIMVVLFVNDLGTLKTIIGAVVTGMIVSLPIAITVTKKLSKLTADSSS